MAADSTCSLKFGPEWIRALSDSSSGQTPQPPPTQATPPRKYPLAKHRYGKEELIAIYEQTLYGDSIPPLSTPGFVYCDGVYIEQSQTPRSLIPMTDEEQRLWASQRVASSRGRGRGITPALWAAPRTLGGHLQQTRNWRSPEKPMSAGGGGSQSAMSTSSQFNYWRKNSLNEDEKVPEWADEKVSEDNDNVGSFDEKGGFLSLESRGRTVDSVGGVSASGNSFLQRSLSGTESEPNVTTTPASLRSGTESNVTKTLNDKPPSPPLPPAATERDAGFPKRERSRDLDEKEPNDIPAGNGIPCAAGVNAAPPVSRVVEDARSSLGQNKRAQVVILGGAGTLNSIPTVSGADQEVTTAVASGRPLQQNSQWASTNRDISEAPLWYYKDPQGIIQGPFSSADMLEWSNQGYFHDSLECRRACDHVFNPLGALKKVWSGTLPFYMPNLHGPISSHLHSVSASTPSAVFNVSNVSMGLGVNPLNASQTLNGFVAPVSAASVAVSSVSRIDALTSELCSESAYYEETSSQFTALTQRQNDFDARNRQIPNDGDAGSEAIGIGHTAVPSRVQLEPELREIESSIRRSVHDLPFNQTVNNHMTVSSDTTSNHRRGIISNRLIEDVSSAVNTRSTAAPTLEQQADSWFSRSPSSSNMAYHRGEMIPPSVNPVVDPTVAPHRTITQHELPNSWLVQRKNERNAEGIQKSSTHHDGTEHVAVNEGSWNDFEYGDSRIMRRSSRPIPIVDMNEPSPQPQPQPQQQQQQRPEQLQPQPAKTPELEPPEDGLHTQSKQQQQIPDEAPFEKVAEKKKKRDRKEKDKQREERLSREKQERDEDQRKQLAQQHSSDEEAEWDSGEQSASGKLSSYQDVIIPAPAPAVPAWGNTQDKAMSALSLQEIQRLEEERASKERQQRQQEAVKNGYYTGIRTWANAIAPTKSFDQIQKEQQASKISAVQNKTQSKSNPTSYTPLSAADVVANGIGGAPTAKSSSSKSTVKMSTVQAVRNNVGGSHVNNNNSNNNNNNGSGSNNNHHHTINNNGGDKPVVASETTNNEQQLIDWCAQITKGLNSYLDMPTVVSILKDVESEAEIEDYVSQFFGESLKEPRQFARQFVQKRAKFNVGLASSLPKQSEWCTTGGNKKRKGAKK